MDPNLFHLDWERTIEAIVGLIVLAFLVERVAALVFESRWFAHNTRVPAPGSEEADREKAGVAAATAVIQAADDPARIAKILAAIEPANPLWPPKPDDPEVMVRRARAHLSLVRARQQRRMTLARLPIKEIGAFVLAAAVCLAVDFDALGIIMLTERTNWWGAVITGAVVAGGSKASIRLFQDLLQIRSTAVAELRKPRGNGGKP